MYKKIEGYYKKVKGKSLKVPINYPRETIYKYMRRKKCQKKQS